MRRAEPSSQTDPPPSATPLPAFPPEPQVVALIPSAKIKERHRQRLAIVYVRQSTTQQIFQNRESTDRQYALEKHAVLLGWHPDDVRTIDEDQGQSGASAVHRTGFQSLLAQIALDQVGLVLGLEMSRLARSNKDWHQLLELCGLFHTLLADPDGVYDPTDYNDRLLLGLKGTMSEAELHILRNRLYQGLLNKAKRGEAFNHPPIGYVKSPDGDFVLDPDEQVQSVVRLLFEQFEREGTVYGLLRYLVRHGIRLPVRSIVKAQRGQLQWRRPNRVTLQSLLRHPIYAGFYRWGYRATDPRRKVAGRPRTGRTVRSPKDCLVLLPDRCPAYISAEQFWANQEQLDANRASAQTRGAVRRGPSLLGGLLVCGRCGCRLMVNYTDGGRGLRYCCTRALVSYGEPECQSLSGTRLDALVAQQVLAILEPSALALHLAAAADVEQQRQALHQHWRQQLERAAYEVERASRQYQAVEPENRLVARELERRWEAALAEQQRLQQEYERFQRTQPARLSAVEQEQIRALSRDIPELWDAETTTAADRQRIVRVLIERVEVTVEGQTERVALSIHWAGGGVSQHTLVRTVNRYEQLADYPRLLARVEQLRGEGKSMEEIAGHLNEEGFHPPKRVERFTGGMVAGFFERQCQKGAGGAREARALLRKGEWLLGDLARQLGMPQTTLHRWRRAGWLVARKLSLPGGRWAIWATGTERRRLSRLRRYQERKAHQPIPVELTTPDLSKMK